MSTIVEHKHTLEDVLAMSDSAGIELVNGELVEKNVSMESSDIAMEIGSLLKQFVRTRDLGSVLGPDLGYACFESVTGDRNRLRKPDVSFIATGRVSPEQYETGHCPVCPDLAVEVISPNDVADELQQKLEEYLKAGVRLVWIVSPRTRAVDVYRPDGSALRLHEKDTLSGEDVIPGFECSVAEIFPKFPTAKS